MLLIEDDPAISKQDIESFIIGSRNDPEFTIKNISLTVVLCLNHAMERAPAAEIVPGVAGIPVNSVSERIEEIDQILLLLARESEVEAHVIEVHHVQQIACGTIVEIRRAGS